MVEEILANEPQNIYAKRYESLLRPYLNDKSEVGKIATVKWKHLRCPHCEASIGVSALNEYQKTQIRENNYNNLEIKCPYCHTQFVLQKKSAPSIIGIQIGDTIDYNNKKYRVVGAVGYEGQWLEGPYSGALAYLEWILLGSDNSYLYFSEWYFIDDGAKYYEFEFSEKIIPNFDLEVDEKSLKINGSIYNFTETNFVKVTSLYGENSKQHTIGESVELASFVYIWEDYIVEKESAWRQSEAGVYKSETIPQILAYKIFDKKEELKQYQHNFRKNQIIGTLLFYGLIGIIIFLSTGGNIIVAYILLFIAFLYLAKSFYKNIWFQILALWPAFAVFVYFVSIFFLESKTQVNLSEVDFGKKFQIEFSDPSLQVTSTGSSKRYDYGGVETTYHTRKWLEFSVRNNDDKEIIKNILQGDSTDLQLLKTFEEPIYQYR